MEFKTLKEASAWADYVANLCAENRFVLGPFTGEVYLVCGPRARAELWPDREAVYVSAPLAGYA